VSAGSARRVAHRARAAVRRRRVVTVQAGAASGLRIGLDSASADYESGTNEEALQRVIVDRLGPGAVFYDVGSNVGFFTLIAARRVGDLGQVHAFEAVPDVARALRRNVERNRFANVTVHECAVGAAEGVVDLFLSSHPGGATISERDRPRNHTRTITTRVTTLDDVVDAGARPPDLLKVDVEGAELDVLEGATRVIDRARPVVVCEVDDADARRAETKTEAVRGFLAGRGYGVTRLGDAYPDGRSVVVHLLGEPA